MTYQLNWGQSGAWSYALDNTEPISSTNPGNGSGTLVATAVGAVQQGQTLEPLPIVFTNTFFGRMRRMSQGTEGNMLVTPGSVGGTGAPGLEMWQGITPQSARTTATVHNDRQTIEFNFGRPVTNLQFTISDIDSHQPNTGTGGNGQYRDAVYVSQAPTSVTVGNRIQGEGTPSDPWTPNIAPNNGGQNASALDNATSNRGNINLTYAGPIQSLAVTFYNTETRAVTGNGQQAIYFSNFTFNANSCVNPYV